MDRRSRMGSVFQSRQEDEGSYVRRESGLWRGGEPEVRCSVENPGEETGSLCPVGKSRQRERGVCSQTHRAMADHRARILVLRVVRLLARHVVGHRIPIRGHAHYGMGLPGGGLQGTDGVARVSLGKGPCADLSAREDPAKNSLEEQSEHRRRRNRAPHATSHQERFAEDISACTGRRDRPVPRARSPQRYHPGR